MWNELEHNFGAVLSQSTVTATFTYTGDKTISEAIPSCGCSTVNMYGKTIQVNYEAPSLPPNVHSMDFRKHVVIKYTSDDQDILTIYGNVVPNMIS